MKALKLIVLVLFSLSLQCMKAQAIRGGELVMEKISGSIYKASLYSSIDWPSSSSGAFAKINWGDGSALDSIPYVSGVCTWEGASALLYQGNHTFPATGVFWVHIEDYFCVSNITNIPNSNTQKLMFGQQITTTIFNKPPTSSFAGCLNDKTCNTSSFSFSTSEYDPDGDSLSYAISNHTEITGYVQPPFLIDGINGLISSSPNITSGFYNVSAKTIEWRKDLSGVYQVIGYGTKEYSFMVDNCTGISEREQFSPGKILPNPSNGNFTLVVPTNGNTEVTLEIIDVSGRLLEKGVKENQGSNITFNISGKYKTGLYFLRLTKNAEQYTYRFVIE